MFGNAWAICGTISMSFWISGAMNWKAPTMNPTSAPGVTIDIVEPRPDASPVRADTAGFVVVCERGPIGVAVSAAPDVQGLKDRWDVPGIFVGVSEVLAESFSPEDVVEAVRRWIE